MSEDVFEFEGAQVTLAELAGLSTEGVAEVRSMAFPKGNYDWEIEEGGIETVGQGENRAPLIFVKAKCINVHATDYEGDAADLIGRSHREGWYIRDLKEGVGRFVAFKNDAGFEGNVQLGSITELMAGHRFSAKMNHRKDKNDPDKIYTNFKDVAPLNAA